MLGTAADAVGLADVFAKALAGIVTVLANVASFAVRQEAIYAEFRKAGHDIREPVDLFALELEEVDEAARCLHAKYTSLAFAERASAGALGAPGLIADIPALVTLNLHAIDPDQSG